MLPVRTVSCQQADIHPKEKQTETKSETAIQRRMRAPIHRCINLGMRSPNFEFEDTVPIDDPLVVLDLLYVRWGSCSSREIVRYFRDTGPYVEVGYHRDFSVSTIYRFRVTEQVVDRLLAAYQIDGKPEWGYRDMKCLRITEAGESHLWNERERLGLVSEVTAEKWYLCGSRCR